jgi:hypothetical protein
MFGVSPGNDLNYHRRMACDIRVPLHSAGTVYCHHDRMTAHRRRWVLLTAGFVVIAAMVVTTVVLWKPGSGSAEPRGPMPLGDRQLCTDRVLLYLDGDDVMTRAASAIADDPQIAKIYTQTTQQADERFRRIFADQPEILESTGPNVLGAVVHVVPSSRVGVRDLADRLRTRFPEAKKVDPIVHDETPPGMTEAPPPCPPSGEWPTSG